MVLSFVPLAEPENVFGRGWDLAMRTVLGLVRISVLQCCLDPGVKVVLLLLFEVLPHLPVGVPVQSGQQVLAVLLTGESGCALLLSFSCEGSLDGPPWLLKVKLFCQH